MRTRTIKVHGYDDKAAQLASAEAQIQQLQAEIDKHKAAAKKSKAEIQRLKQALKDTDTTKQAATPLKPKKKSAAAWPPTIQLPPSTLFTARPSVPVPMAMMPTTALADSIIESGIGLLKSTDQEDWASRATNWLVLAESRPRLEYK
jgi:seryl-tRNA synthetase